MSYLPAIWPAPKHIIAGVTLRTGGISQSSYATNNYALHVGDSEELVLRNRAVLEAKLPPIKYWQWLEQVHGTKVINAPSGEVSIADASYSSQKDIVCSVLTADCLPILICDKQGLEVAAIHAGWRSLCSGIIENTVDLFSQPATEILVWFGPAIGPTQFEVGIDVVNAFAAEKCGRESLLAFKETQLDGKFLGNIYHLAKIRLQNLGINAIYGGDFCTVSESERFYSFRRERVTGRMVSFIYSSSSFSQV